MRGNKTLFYLLVLLSIILLGLALEETVNQVFNKLELDINNGIHNDNKKIEIGVIILNYLPNIEIETIKLFKARSPHSIKMQTQKINNLTTEIEKCLDVLESGGTFKSTFQVNTQLYAQNDTITKEITYIAQPSERYLHPILDLRPKLITLTDKLQLAEDMLIGNLLKNDPPSPAANHDLLILEKTFTPFFQRMREHANQILNEAEKTRKANLQEAHQLRSSYKTIRTGIIAGIFAGIIILGIMVSMQIVKDNKKIISASKNIDILLQSLPVGIILIDTKKKIRGINSEAISIFQIESPAECIGQQYEKIIKFDYEENVDDEIFLGESGSITKTTKVKNYKGKILDILIISTPLELNGELMILDSFMDISKLKETERNLEISASRWQNTFNAMRDMIAVIDKNMQIIAYNKAMEDTFPDIKKGQTSCHALVHGLCGPIDKCVAKTTFSTGKVAQMDIFEEHMGGRWIDARTFPVKNENGEVTQIIHTFRDITSLKQYENDIIAAKETAEAANEAKSIFLSMMSHEIRTPMNGVIGMTELLADTELDNEQQDFVNTIRISGDALLTVINDILDYSKIEAGKLELESCPLELSMAIEDSVELMCVQAVTKKHQLTP